MFGCAARSLTWRLRKAVRNPPKHHALGNQAAWDAATSALVADPKEFTVTATPDAAGPTQVLTRTAGTQTYLIIRYHL